MATLNLTASLEAVIADIVCRVDELSHIDPARLLVAVAASRNGTRHRLFAKIHPLRFKGGDKSAEERSGRSRYLLTMPTIEHRGTEMLYLIYFLVPRFLDLPFQEKLVTIFHELYHISPAFDGDIRRFAGRNHAHGSSTKRYNQFMATLVDRYLKGLENSDHLEFLATDQSTLRENYRAIVARKLPAPRLGVKRIVS